MQLGVIGQSKVTDTPEVVISLDVLAAAAACCSGGAPAVLIHLSYILMDAGLSKYVCVN